MIKILTDNKLTSCITFKLDQKSKPGMSAINQVGIYLDYLVVATDFEGDVVATKEFNSNDERESFIDYIVDSIDTRKVIDFRGDNWKKRRCKLQHSIKKYIKFNRENHEECIDFLVKEFNIYKAINQIDYIEFFRTRNSDEVSKIISNKEYICKVKYKNTEVMEIIPDHKFELLFKEEK